ncbi:uncharacterized protein si:ch1073-59l16.1 isoform X7 [Xyrauchen texanus]|uniref:uncharacterized protein si:ch1073-59l16.1 isoform X7 n=1 Tax=Xyrauchen texanus TaxID=154827 RepID=UPI0022419BAA|nr:uncharacterized protein si:ch1073-59l16.1 isoform X7 [Xyrauchen texanus]
MMDLCNLLFIFLLMKLSGTQDVTTVRKISVQKGKSITIPCLYRQEYTNSYKYLRAGYNWLFSKYIESSDHQCNHSTVCISDDTSHNIFTVHMNNIQESGNFWCAVRIPYGWDKRTGFFLEVTEGRLKSTNQAAGESHYVIMNRKRSSHSHGCAATVEGAYEHMDGLKRNTESHGCAATVEGAYEHMDGLKRNTESHGCAATVEGAYEHMDGLKRNTESHCCATGERTYKDTVGLERNIKLPASGNKFTCPSVVKNSDL